MSLHIYFENMQDKHRVTYALKMLVRGAIEATLAFESVIADCEVSVTFADNEGIRAINREYREIDAPTDVLSFPLFEVRLRKNKGHDQYGHTPQSCLGEPTCC